MPEITDTDLASICSSLSSCSPLVRGLAERLRKVEEDNKRLCPTCHGHGDITVSSGQTPESYYVENIECPDCVGLIRADDRVEISALRERIKRMEEALQRIGQVEPRFLSQQEMFDTARAALKEGGE